MRAEPQPRTLRLGATLLRSGQAEICATQFSCRYQKKLPRHCAGAGWAAFRLKAELQRELELPRVEGGGGRAGLRVERVDVGNVEAVDKVEHVHNALQIHALAQLEVAGHTEIGEGGPRTGGRVAADVAIERAGEDAVHGPINEAGRLEEAGRRELRRRGGQASRGNRRSSLRSADCIGAIGVRREIEVCIRADQDIEWATGAELDDRCHSPIAADFVPQAFAVSDFAALIDATEHEAMALIECRAGALEVGTKIVGGLEQRLQVGGIVNSVRISVRPQEFVVIGETLLQIDGGAVIDGAAVREVCHHVAERNGNAEAEPIGRDHRLYQSLASDARRTEQRESGEERWIETRRPKETRHRRRDERLAVGSDAASGDAKRAAAGGRWIARQQSVFPVADEQITAHRIHVDGTVEVVAAVEVVSDAD